MDDKFIAELYMELCESDNPDQSTTLLMLNWCREEAFNLIVRGTTAAHLAPWLRAELLSTWWSTTEGEHPPDVVALSLPDGTWYFEPEVDISDGGHDGLYPIEVVLSGVVRFKSRAGEKLTPCKPRDIGPLMRLELRELNSAEVQVIGEYIPYPPRVRTFADRLRATIERIFQVREVWPGDRWDNSARPPAPATSGAEPAATAAGEPGPLMLQLGGPGRKRDPLYDEAAERLRKGEGFLAVFEWFCLESNISAPDKNLRDAFKAAMKRRLNNT
jgi:hypothetical protein